MAMEGCLADMSEDVSVLLQRSGQNVVAKPFLIQLDYLGMRETSFNSGADPAMAFEGFTTMLPTIDPHLMRQDDQLIDQVIVDPIRQSLGLAQPNRVWRIVSKPEMFAQDGHWQFECVGYRGT